MAFFDAIKDFDDVTLHTISCDAMRPVLRHLSSHSWPVADSPSKVLLTVTAKNENSMPRGLVVNSNLELNHELRAFNPRGFENTDYLSTEETHSPPDNYPKNIRSCHSQDADFVKNVVILKTTLSKALLPELQRKWSQRRLLPKIYEQFNEAELWYVNAAPDRHWLRYLMLRDSTYQCDTRLHSWQRRFSESAVLQIEILTYWIDELNLIQFSDKNETCQTLTLEPNNAENLVRGCNQFLSIAELPYSSIHIQSPKPDSPRTQL
ncbi:hypothetical protein ACTXT7_002316 [Hymenolepis weldensis]